MEVDLFVLFLSSKCVIVNGGFIMEKDVNTSSISSLARVQLYSYFTQMGCNSKGVPWIFITQETRPFPSRMLKRWLLKRSRRSHQQGRDMERCNSRVAKCLPQGFWMWKAARNSWSYYFFLDDMRCNTVTLCRLEGVVFLEAVTFKHTTRVEKRVEHFNLLSGGGRQKTSTVPCRAYNMRQR